MDDLHHDFLNVQKIGLINPILVKVFFSLAFSFAMCMKGEEKICFLCLKPITHHSHGIRTIPESDRKLLMFYWNETDATVSGHK